MNIEIKDFITLSDNNQYVVCSKAIKDNKTYYFLMDINNSTNIKFCIEDDDSLVEIEDPEEIKKIVPDIVKQGMKAIEEIK